MTAPTESLTLRSTDRARGTVVDVPARDLAAGAGATAAGARRIHPLMAAAAVSVIVLSATGVAALTGLIGPRHADAPAALATAAPAEMPAPSAGPATATAQTAPAPGGDATRPEASRPAAAPPPVARAATHAAPRAATSAQVSAAAAPVAAATQSAAPADARPASAPPVAAAPAPAADWGTVQSVREVKVDGQPSAVGTVAGGVLGAVLGHQMGKGRGRDVGTVLGGIGGAFAGRAVESKAKASSHWEMTVRLDDGSTRTFSRGSPWSFQAGERVHMVDGQPASRG